MQTKKIELSATVNIALNNIACKTDDLLSDECLKTLTSYLDNKATPLKPTKISEERFKKLLEQVPEGIWISVKQLLSYVEGARKRNNIESITNSPLVLTYSDFKCCKLMKYQKGHIITGRDMEIDKILLTLCKSSKRGVILVGEPGVGKAQPIDSTILTPSGWIKIKDLKIGDSVICPDNSKAKVLGIFPQGKKQVNEITFSDGRKTECCNEHLWKVYSKNWKRLGSESRVIESNLIKQIKEKTRERLYINLVKPIDTKEIELEIDPYILGVLIGDGSLTKGPHFTKQDKEIREKVRSKLDKNHSLTEHPDKKTITASIISNSNNIYSNKYRNFIKSVGLDVTSEFKYIPEIYLNSSIASKTELLRGLMDTNGTVCSTGTLQYSTSSKQLAENIQYLVRSLGGIASISKKYPKFTYKGIKKEGKLSYIVNIRIPNPRNYVTLKRKLDRIPIDYQYNNLKLEITKIKELGEKECVCIYIDHPDHLYITNDFIVTHNTAIVNAINARLIERTVPRQLLGAQILNLDIPYVFTKFKEDPMGTIIKVLERASSYDKAILFIDEVHQLLGHKMNDVMKPYLTEQIRFIGSTTINEYHSIITDDVALERRFTVVNIAEPSIDQTIAMIKGTKSVLEEEHKCTIPEDVCEYTVVNGSRFLGHRKNPDKSLDLLDIACAILNEKEITLETKREEPKNEYIPDLELNKNEIESAKLVPGSRILTTDYVNLAISSVTNISYGKIKNSLEFKEVLGALQEKIFGQDEAIKTLANIVNIFKHVKYDRERPIATLLVVGPSGVGKKSAAQLLAKNLYGKDSAYIEYDMTGMTSEFMITELKGAPPGYVGYGKSGGLIKSIRNNPQSIVYFRGINKADESIIQYVIDASRHGKITDSAEREASLNNTVIIFGVTLNDEETAKVFKGKARAMGFSPAKEEQKGEVNHDELKKIVGEDLMKSVDEVIVFNQLSKENLKQIFDANIQRNLEMYDVDIDRVEIQERVLSDSKNGHDVVSRLTSEVPKIVFKTLKQE